VLAKVMNCQMIKYNIVMCCYDKILVNVAAYVIPGCVHHTHTHTHTHTYARARTPNQELHMRPHLPKFYYNSTLLYCLLSSNNN
jgi:hypothetical protein